jgi:hypothetical protein
LLHRGVALTAFLRCIDSVSLLRFGGALKNAWIGVASGISYL